MQAGEERHYKNTLDAWSKIHHEEGLRAYFKVKPGQHPSLVLHPEVASISAETLIASAAKCPANAAPPEAFGLGVLMQSEVTVGTPGYIPHSQISQQTSICKGPSWWSLCQKFFTDPLQTPQPPASHL